MTLFDPRPISDADTFGLNLPDIATQSTATPLEALEAEYNRDRMSFQSLSAETSNRNYWTPILDRIEEVTGQRPDRPDINANREYDAVSQFINQHAPWWVPDTYATSVAAINTLIEEYPELSDLDILSSDEHISAVEQMAIDAERVATEQNRTFLGEAAAFLGSLGADARLMIQDPTYGATNIIGGGAARKAGSLAITNISRAALFEGLLNVGIEGANTPAIAAWRDRVGLKYDAETIGMQLGGAFVGGVAFGGAIATPLELLARRGDTPGAIIGQEMNRAIDEMSLQDVHEKILGLSDREIGEGLKALQDDGVELPPVARGAQEELQAQEDLFDDNPLDDELEHMRRALDADAAIRDEDVAPIPEQPISAPVERARPSAQDPAAAERINKAKAANDAVKAAVKARVEAKERLNDLGIDQKDTPAFQAVMDEIDDLGVKVDKAREEYDAVLDANRAAERTEQPEVAADNLDGVLFRFDPQTIEADAKTFQYKSDGDEFGVTDKYRNTMVWDPSKAGQVIVYEYADGRRVIADGHQRLGMAKRIMAADPSQKPVLYGTLLREVDGVLPEGAMVIAARKNITEAVDQPGSKVLDAAKLERQVPGALDDPSLPVGTTLIRQARDLVDLSDEAFGAVINDVVPTNYAAIVGRLVKDQDKQIAVIQLLADAEPANVTQAEAIVRQALEAEFDAAVQVGLFGEELVTESLFKERARVLDAALKTLKRDRTVFRSLVENRARIEGEGNVLAMDQNQSRSMIDGQAIQLVQTVANRRGPLSDALTAAARDLKETGNAGRSSGSFVDAVRDAVGRGDFDGADVGDPGRAIDVEAEGNRLAASPGREELAAFDDPDGPAVKQQADQLEQDFVDGPREAQQPDVAKRQDLKAKIDAGATRDEIDAHPAVVDALEQAAAIPETKNAPGYLGDDWINSREFIFDGETVIGYDAGVQRLYENARGLGWTDEGLEFPGTINQDRRATIILGPPAAGKSMFANKFAQARNAAIIDPDEAKKALPEYGGGIGANAVHAESSEIFTRVLDTALEAGDNLVVPRTGGRQSDIADIMTLLEDAGYEIDLIRMDVTIDNAHKRMIGRFIGTGRLINPQILYSIGNNPQITYNALKGRAQRYGEIDNNGAPDAPLPTRDTSADNPFAGVAIRLRDAGQRSDQAVDTETTGQGEQTLIPGVEPVTDAQRAQLEVDRPMRGGDRPMDVGLFDTDAQAQTDLLDLVPISREAPDGSMIVEEVSRRQLLDEIDQDQKMIDRFKECVV